MPSLSPERLAALVDEPPTAEEQALLDASPALRAEVAAMRRVVAMAAYERTHPGAPLTGWGALAGALRAEGLVTAPLAPPRVVAAAAPGGHAAASPPAHRGDDGVIDLAHARHRADRSRRPGVPRWGFAAAAALLVTLGVAGGRWSAAGSGAGADPALAAGGARGDASMGTSMGTTSVATMPGGPAMASVDTPIASRLDAPRIDAATRTGASLPIAGGAIPVATRLTTRDQAVRTLQQLEDAHQQAVSWLAANDSSVGAGRRIVGAQELVRDLRRQIEVLDAAVAMGRRVLYESPDDPVMNRYYFSALAAREVLLRKLATALPASQQVLEY
ncbi:MAG: hypothetical protein MUF21_02330 [Gemmatimonadaceae bacterium]|nr:hypothetical protein [Gemmatimonadaceae bacterium]